MKFRAAVWLLAAAWATVSVHADAVGRRDLASRREQGSSPLGACQPDGAHQFSSFGPSSGLVLNGDAEYVSGRLRLAQDAFNRRGTAFLPDPVTLDGSTSFSTRFVFSIDGPGDGADGLTFILQRQGPTALGGYGEGMGYRGLQGSYAVEIDIYDNGYDPNGNHIGIDRNGNMNSLVRHTPSFSLEDGQPHGIWIDYDGVSDRLDVFLSEDPDTKPASPQLSLDVNLPGALGPQVWMGFGGATGALVGDHDIRSWSLDVCAGCVNDAQCDDGVFCNGEETCSGNVCVPGPAPCPADVCNEAASSCVSSQARLETGTVTVGTSYTTVPLTLAYLDPIVVATVQQVVNAAPALTRVANVTGTSFDVRLAHPAGSSLAPEIVHYLVVERGAWYFDDMRIEAERFRSTVTDHDESWVGELRDYLQAYVDPVVLGQVMSENDPDWSVFWSRGGAAADPPSPGAFYVGKTACEDPDITRAPETVGYVVVEAGHGRVGGVEFEAAVGPASVEGVDDGPPFPYAFATELADPAAVVLASIAGMAGDNGAWAKTWGDPAADTARMYLAVDEDQLADPERSHAGERVAYVAFAEALAHEPERCTTSGDCDDGSFCNGLESCVEGYCHDSGEPCGTLACDEQEDTCGFTPLPRVQALTVQADGTPRAVPLSTVFVSPVVACTPTYAANTRPFVPRVDDVRSDRFDLWLQNPSGQPVAEETVSCLVVEEGAWIVDGVRFEAHRFEALGTATSSSWTAEALAYRHSYAQPVVLGQVMTARDADWSVFWCRGASLGSPPTPSSLFVGKTVCEDPDTFRADEELGVIVFEAGRGTLGGVAFEATLGPDTIRGHDNGPPFTYAFTEPFATTPAVLLANMAGVDGANGGWAQTYGAAPATPSLLRLMIDEDQAGDWERSHVHEQVAFVVFEDELVYVATPGCSTDYDCDDGELCNGLEICVSGSCIPVDIECPDGEIGLGP